MRIGIAQLHTTPGAFDQTIERLAVCSEQAAEQGAELLVAPLATLAGPLPVARQDSPSYLLEAIESLAVLAKRLQVPAIIPLVMSASEQEGYYEAFLVEDGTIRPLRAFVHMRNLQSRTHEVCEFDWHGTTIALAFVPEDINDLCDYAYDATVVLYIAAESFALDNPDTAMAAALESAGFELDAQEMDAWFVGVASVGGYGTEVYAGGSFVIDPQGALVAAAPSFEDALLVADVDVSPAAEHIAGHETGRADGRATEYALDHVAHDMPHLDPYEPALYAWQAVARAIADFAEAQAKTDVALALDGSLSSQAIAVLASDALGPAHVHVLVSSCAGRLAASCRELARRLRIDQRDGTAPAQGFDARDWAGLELARLARESQALVLGTWDKTALALGLVPDSVSAAAFAPLGDVYRTDVLEMAHLRNSISPIFRRVALHVADGFVLRDPEGKEHRINGERELLQVDTILLDYLEYSRTLADICTNTDFDTQLVAAVLDACRAGEALRRRLAPALVMGSCPLAEAGFPLGVAWDDRTFELPSDNEMLPISFAMPDLESALRADDMADSADDADDDDAFAEAHRGRSHDPDWYDDADAKSVNGMGPRHDDGVRQDSDGTDAQDSGPDGEGTRREGRARRARNEALPREARDFEATLSMLRDIFEQGGLGPATTPLRTDDPEHPQGPSWTTLFSEN